MSVEQRTFKPLAATQNIEVTTSSQVVTLNFTHGTHAIRLVNKGTALVFVEFSKDAAPTADATTSLPLPAGQTEVFTLATGVISYAVIADGAGSTLYSTVGEGL
jgi:hypothetical protein